MAFSDLARQLDALLRGGYTKEEDLQHGRVDLPVGTLVLASVLLGAIYGLFMGLFAVLRPVNPSVAQLLATTVKVPLLFLATLFVTFPSLYVFSALSGTRLEPRATLQLLLGAIAVNLTVLASFGPVTGFFTLSTDSYPFMVLLSVVFFIVSGVIGLAFLSRTLDRVYAGEQREQAARQPEPTEATGVQAPGTADSPWKQAAGASPAQRRPAPAPADRPGRNVLRVWVVIYAIVGAQMGWILRPFIGAPNSEFTFFRERGGNFVRAILEALRDLSS